MLMLDLFSIGEFNFCHAPAYRHLQRSNYLQIINTYSIPLPSSAFHLHFRLHPAHHQVRVDWKIMLVDSFDSHWPRVWSTKNFHYLQSYGASIHHHCHHRFGKITLWFLLHKFTLCQSKTHWLHFYYFLIDMWLFIFRYHISWLHHSDSLIISIFKSVWRCYCNSCVIAHSSHYFSSACFSVLLISRSAEHPLKN